MKVWIIYKDYYDDNYIVGVYSSEEKADKFYDELGGQANFFNIQCWEVDDKMEELRWWLIKFKNEQYENNGWRYRPKAVEEAFDDFLWNTWKFRLNNA